MSGRPSARRSRYEAMELDQTLVDELLAANILADRVAKGRDPMRESIAIDKLIGRINSTPDAALQALVETAAELSDAGSAGVSLLERDRFVWRAIAGAWAHYVGDGIPFDASPCGVVIARDAPLLFSEPHRRFAQIRGEPPIHEALLVPLRLLGRPIGTLWVLSHDHHRFDTEDVRILERLASFATAIEEMRRSRAQSAEAITSARAHILETVTMIRSVTRDAVAGDIPTSAEERLVRFGARISAYADAVAYRSPDISTDLWLLLAATLKRFGERPDERISLDGPDAAIPPKQAGTLGLAFHELLDNAFRHGALRTEAGRVDIRWAVKDEGERSLLHLRWDERGPPHSPTRIQKSGFGFELLTIGLPEMIAAQTEFDLRPEGLCFVLSMPMKVTG